MAGVVVLVVVVSVMGLCLGAFIKVSFAIRQEDRQRGSLRRDAPNRSSETARALVGVNGWRRD